MPDTAGACAAGTGPGADFAGAVEGRHWQPVGDNRVRCDVCPRHCTLLEGQRGLCFVRAAQNGRIVLTTYGRSSGFCIDPIEKKPLNHFLPGTSVLSFGTAGCNLTCKFCQNWDISRAREMDRLQDTASPRQIARAARHSGCRSVAFTYNDPAIFLEYAVDVAQACHEEGLKTVAVTAGYLTDAARRDLFAPMDAANVDLKAFDEAFYHRLCTGHLEPIKETLQYLVQETRVWTEVTTLLIPGQNDSDRELDALTQWMVDALGPDVPLHFSAFHPDWRMMDSPATPLQTLRRARDIARRNGIHHCYTGNVHDPDGASTRCAACGALLIERDWYQLGVVRLGSDGRCPACGTVCAGVFDDQPGDWGRRRARVRPADY